MSESNQVTGFNEKSILRKLNAPSRYSLQDLFAELKFGRRAEDQKYLDRLINELNNEDYTDSEMLDYLQDIMTDDENFVEIYLSGIRNWTGKARAFQLELNPSIDPVIEKTTLRQAISELMNRKWK